MAESAAPSAFYFQCRNNEYDQVRELVVQLPLAEMDRMEPNGSTALHAACFYRCEQIISLLLDRGFTRRVKNKYGFTPIDECPEDLKRLFLRPKTSNRFGGATSLKQENTFWLNVTNGEDKANIYQNNDAYSGKRLLHGIFHADAICQHLRAKNMEKVDVIERLFRRAIDEKDCIRLIQAFTSATEFSNVINLFLTSPLEFDGPSPLPEFIDTICSNAPLHQQYAFKGKCYRAIKVTSKNDLSVYQKDQKLLNRTFLSATKTRELALDYVSDRQVESEYTAILCFNIRYDHAALDIAQISEFPHEDEVLILINRVFRVIGITSNNTHPDFEIELRESKR